MLPRIAAVMAIACFAAPAAAQCGEGARIGGTPELVSSLRDALRARGGHVLEDPSCADPRALNVEVTPSGDRIRVMLRGPDGSSAVRDVDRMTTAALLVESWTQATQLDLLEPPRTDASTVVADERPDAAAVAQSPTPPASAALPEATQLAEPTAPVATVSAAAIAAFGNEGSSWFGAQLGACAHAGPTCLGGSLRYLADSGLSDGTPAEGGQRTSLGVDVDVSLPFSVGAGLTLTPAVALGLGWLDVIVIDATRSVVIDGVRALVSGSFAGAVALIEWLALELRFALTWSPLARQLAWTAQGLSVDPDPVVLASVMLGVRADIR